VGLGVEDEEVIARQHSQRKRRSRLLAPCFKMLLTNLQILSSAEDCERNIKWGFEVAMVGNEGAIGIPIVLRTNKTPYQVMVQIPVRSAFRIKAEVLRNEFDRGGKFRDLMLRYTEVVLTQITQSAVCNHFHSSVQRLARWLLIANDLVERDTFYLTHEFISHMLGSPRTGVTMAAGVLQKTGLLSYTRGKITILDRSGLEEAACECYKIVRESFDHFLDSEEANV